MTDLLLLVLLVATTWTVARFVVRDELPLMKIPRDALANWLDPRGDNGEVLEPSPAGGLGRALAYLVECARCASAWVGAAVVWAADAMVGLPLPVLWWGAVWAGASLLAGLEQRADRRDELVAAQAADVARRR